jgi:uncharacterized protein (DUF58 family)
VTGVARALAADATRRTRAATIVPVPLAATLNPAALVRSRFHAWLEARLPRRETHLLTQGNIYILPTKAGLLFGATLLVLLIASVNYQLNLGYVLTFLLAGSGVVSMHVTHATLRGLTLHLKPVAAAFAHGPAVLDVVMTNPGAARYGIGLRLAGAPIETLAWTNVPQVGQATAHVSFVPTARGLHEVPRVSVETRFPLGLFRAWTVWRPASRVLVYPPVERDAPRPPAARPVPGGPTRSRSLDGGEMEGVRAYRRGDAMKRIAWKKAAKSMETGGDLVTRDTSSSSHQELWLDWAACTGLGPEDRLSRLAAWTLAAHRAGTDYGLRAPGLEVAPGSGDPHQRACLEALALWQA